MIEEKWKDIEGFEGLYQISTKGRIKSFYSNSNGKILKLKPQKKYYTSVTLVKNKKKYHFHIHRLVALAFIPNNDKKKTIINHKDCDKHNNCVDNLEWCDYKYNLEYAKKMGKWKYNKPYKCRTVYQYTLDGKFISSYESCKDAERKTNVCSRDILSVANKEPFNKNGNIRKQAGGFFWSFVKL